MVAMADYKISMADLQSGTRPEGAFVRIRDLLARNISFAPRVTARTAALGCTTVGQSLQDIVSGRWSAEVAQVRNALKSDKAEADKMKLRLPALKPSGVFQGLGADTLQRHSEVLCLDFDGVADLPGAKRILRDDPHVLAVFESVSGNGLKAFVPIAASNCADHKQCFESAHAHFAAKGLNADKHCSDVGRNCFVSHDPDAWVREGNLGEEMRRFSLHTSTCSLHASTSLYMPLHVLHGSTCSTWHSDRIGAVKAAQAELDAHPRLARIYRDWIERIAARPGERNAALTTLVPRLYDKVSEDVLLWLMLKFYDLNAGVFKDPRTQHEKEARELITAIGTSYPASQKLTDGEQRAYADLEGEERVALRICRSLASCKANEKLGMFGLSCDELAARLHLKPDTKGSHRLFTRFVAYGILEMVKKGDRQQIGGPRAKATMWKCLPL